MNSYMFVNTQQKQILNVQCFMIFFYYKLYESK